MGRLMRRNGFTLVEIIVVLVILAILAAIMIPAMTGWIDSAREKRLLSSCRACVVAAQTLASESYGSGAPDAVPTAEAITALAGMDGAVSNVTLAADGATVASLTYTEDNSSATYLLTPQPHYVFAEETALPGWSAGATYAVGDKIAINGVMFQCVSAHTAGNTKTTRNPDDLKNTSWRVIGYEGDEIKNFASRYCYAEGVIVYNSFTKQYFRRLAYSPTVTPSPSDDGLYWEKVEM